MRKFRVLLEPNETGGYTVTVPFHHQELAPKTPQTILRQAGISVEAYARLL